MRAFIAELKTSRELRQATFGLLGAMVSFLASLGFIACALSALDKRDFQMSALYLICALLTMIGQELSAIRRKLDA